MFMMKCFLDKGKRLRIARREIYAQIKCRSTTVVVKWNRHAFDSGKNSMI